MPMVKYTLVICSYMGGGGFSHVTVLPCLLLKHECLKQWYYGENTGTSHYILRQMSPRPHRIGFIKGVFTTHVGCPSIASACINQAYSPGPDCVMLQFIGLLHTISVLSDQLYVYTERSISYRKCVLYLLTHMFRVHLSRLQDRFAVIYGPPCMFL